MDDRLRATAVAVARHLLLSFKETHPAWSDDRTPIDELVSWLGLQVATFHPEDYMQGTYGFVEPNEDLIWLCRNLSEPLRRFTLAHELGHVLLHCHPGQAQQMLTNLGAIPAYSQPLIPEISREDPCQGPDVQEEAVDQDPFEEVLGIGQSYNPRSQRELAANIFAAELLMPLERVRTLYLTLRTPADALATIFGVSTTAMLNRLLGLLQPGHPRALQEAPKQDEQGTSSLKKQYDEYQRAAIETSTPALIVAGPGSGKTSTLIGRSEYLISTMGVPPEHILALTFSRKAAQEMEDRLRQALPDKTTFPTVSTFHAFCAESLRTYGPRAGLRPDFALIDEAEGYFLLRQLAKSLKLRHYRDVWSPARYFPDILQAISRAKDELVTPEQYQELAQRMLEQAQGDEAVQEAEKALEVASVYTLYEEALQRRGDSDFGGLLLLTVRLFQRYPEIRYEQQQRYPHILVDEFQDMNRASGVLLRELAGEKRQVWVVGDANQAIYAFRGASPANIANFQADYPGAVVLPLGRNYRSLPDIVQLAESFRCGQLELGTETGKNQPVRLTLTDTYITLAKAADDASELNGIIHDIRAKHTQGYRYQDIVVLCRTRAQTRKISRALAQAGLPVIERGSMLEQEHIKALLSFVLLLSEPSGMGILCTARQSEHPLTQSDVEALLLEARKQDSPLSRLILNDEAPYDLSPAGRRSLRHLSAIFQDVQHASNVWELLARYVFIETSLVRDLLGAENSKHQRHMFADYAHMLHLARRYDQQQQEQRRQREQEAADRGEAFSPPTIQEQAKGFLDYLRVMLVLRQDGSNRQHGTGSSEEDVADVIRVMTIHASKGLEFPVVYLPGLSQRRFPLPKQYSPISAPTGMLPPESIGGTAHTSGEACLFYVGVTRARDQLALSYSQRYGKQRAKPSPFLDPLIAGMTEDRISTVHWESNIEATDEEEEPGDLTLSSQPSEHFIHVMQASPLSASAIETYQQCPRRYAYSMIYGFRQEEASQLFLQAMQQTMDVLHKRQLETNGEKQLPTQQEVAELYTHHWQELGGHDFPFATMYEQHGHEAIELIRRSLAAQHDVSWELHPKVAVDVAGRTVQVRIDRVEAPAEAGKPVKFVRTRYGRRKEKPEAKTRELLYAQAYRQQYPGYEVELHEHNLSTGEMSPIPLTKKKEQSLYESVEEAIKGIENHEYPAKPDPFYCPGCPFFLICPA